MIISTGTRTDIINHYSDWLFERFREGYVFTRNPLFPGRVTRYTLSPEKVDAVLFCSKNYAPALGRLSRITTRYNTFFHYTITAYGKDIEPNIPSIGERIETLLSLSKLVGREKVMWRFEPVFFSKRYPQERVLETFARIAERIAPHVCGCTFGFIEPFFTLRSRLPEIVLPDTAQKRDFARLLAPIAKRYSLHLQSCGTLDSYEEYGIAREGCYTLGRIGKANGCTFREMQHRGTRRGCLCITSRDIGWYDSCPNLCKYCNANHSVMEVKENVLQHDAHSPLLIGNIREDDEIIEGVQRSFLRDARQISLFDM